VFLQVLLDLGALTILLHLAGGVENPFVLFFAFHMAIARRRSVEIAPVKDFSQGGSKAEISAGSAECPVLKWMLTVVSTW